MDSNRIEKSIELNAPVSRVWRALTDHREFGEWFLVQLEAPFQPGQPSRGQITYPGLEYVKFRAVVQKIEPEHTFSFTWHPYAVDPSIDYSTETPTLVEFTLTPTPTEVPDGRSLPVGVATGTLLRVTESGFENLPEPRRSEALRMDDGGWTVQMSHIEAYVAKHP
jgi:uncharacterized protein YndB with AHSA1/START domain